MWIALMRRRSFGTASRLSHHNSMRTGLQTMSQKYFIALIAAVASILAPPTAATSFAQGPMAGASGFAIPATDESGHFAAPPESPSGDLVPFPASPNGLTTRAGSQDQGGAADQTSAAGAQPKLSVNPITGLVASREPSYAPLTGEERWKLYWKMNYFSMGAYFGPFFSALVLDQATGSPAPWGGGLAGYGRRVASRTGSAILQGTFQAPAAYLLHEDVRYIASKRHGFRHRVVHAVLYSFLTYNNSGRPTLNVANLGAYYASTAASTVWLPGRYKVLDYTLSNSTEQLGLTVPVNMLQEFWPEITRRFHRP
jgi:hypothetical protein